MDPYVAPPREPAPSGRLDWLRPWVVAAIALLLMAALAATWLVSGRQDPSLEVPEELFGTAAPITVPEAAPTGS